MGRMGRRMCLPRQERHFLLETYRPFAMTTEWITLYYGINDVGIQDLEESGFKTLYSDGLTVCLKRSTV